MAWLNKPDDTRQAWRHRSQNPPLDAKNLADISYTDRVIANCLKFCCHGNGGRWAKMWLAAFNGPSPKIPYRCKNLSDIFYTSRVIINFVQNFVAMATGVGGGKCNWQHSMAHPRKPPYRRENFAKISYASPVSYTHLTLPTKRIV